MKNLFNAYRVLAIDRRRPAGLLALVGPPAEVPRHRGQPTSQQFGESRQHLWVAHGWLFMIYVVVASSCCPPGPLDARFTLLVLAAGLIPLLIFWVEHRVAQRMRAEHPELARTGARRVARDDRVRARRRGRARRGRGRHAARALRARHRPGPGARHQRRRAQRRDGRARPDARRSSTGSPTCGEAPAETAARCTATGRCARSGARSSTGTHIYSAEPLRKRLRRGARRRHLRGARRCGSRCCAASIERAAEHWFDSGPVVDAVVASAAVPGLLPPAQVGDEHFLDGGIVNSIPLGRAVAARRHPGLRAPGRPDRPAAAACPGEPWEVARVSFEIARRHRFAREMAELPDGVEAHVLPARRHLEPRRLAARPTGTSSSVQRRIDATYDAAAGLPRRSSRRPMSRPGDPAAAPVVLAPAVVVLTVLLWVTLPAVAARPRPRCRRCCRGAGGRCGCCGWSILYLTCEAVLLVVLFGLWLASGFGWRIRTPYFEGIHYDLVQGLPVGVLPRGPAGAAAEHRAPTARRRTPTRASRCWSAAGTPGPGDSFTLIHALMHWYDREPRVVLKDTLAWDPAIDVLLNRIPARFISPNPGGGRGPRVADRRRWPPASTRTTRS